MSIYQFIIGFIILIVSWKILSLSWKLNIKVFGWFGNLISKLFKFMIWVIIAPFFISGVVIASGGLAIVGLTLVYAVMYFTFSIVHYLNIYL